MTEEKNTALLENLRKLPEGEREDLIVAALQVKNVARRGYLCVPEPPPPPLPPPLAAPEGDAELMTEDQARAEGLVRPAVPGQVDYIVRHPVGLAVLRRLKQSVYDKLIVPENGNVGRVSLFTEPRFFPDHSPKTEADCNLTMAGGLGMPVEYDLRWIDIVFEKFSHPSDLKRVLKGLHFRWIRGQMVPWLRMTLSGFTPFLSAGDEQTERAASKKLAQFAEEGSWTHYRADVRTPEGTPQRITSTESFRVDVEGNLGELHGPVHLKVMLQDTIYVPI